MSRFKLSRAAEQDLRSIWLYSAQEWGRRQADAYVLRLCATIEKTAAKPERGRKCADVREGYYRVASGSHLIFYRIENDRIHVVRILHQAMDFKRHL